MMSLNEIYAHTPPKEAPHRWHMLEDHAIETARTTYAFARAFGSENAGFALGIFHRSRKSQSSFSRLSQWMQ